MIIKSYEVKKNKSNLIKNNFFLLYGENLGLKKDIKDCITTEINQLTGTSNTIVKWLCDNKLSNTNL